VIFCFQFISALTDENNSTSQDKMKGFTCFIFREQTIETTYIQHLFHLEYNLQVHPVQKNIICQSKF